MKQYKVWIHVEEIDTDRDRYQDLDLPIEAGCFESESKARQFVDNELMTTQISGSAADLLEVCKDLTSYTSGLLYRLDDQVNTDEVEEIRQAKEVIANYRPVERPSLQQFEMMLQEQSPDLPPKSIKLSFLAENEQLWIRPAGFGEKCTTDGEGSPVGMEIWQGRLRVIVFNDINSEDPQIIDLENARETARSRCNWCDKETKENSIKWNGLLFCSESCLDACRAAQ
ncbi:MAG: hypothetical protein DRP56_00445 [Planctomycetota bacterium]|nr:MAG: hypothetical protein DRP56_00445 [Planctomycetota bacterium]